MKIELVLGEADRAAYGCPDVLTLDLERWSVQEAMDLETAGIDFHRVRHGEDVPDPKTGAPAVDEATGAPIRRYGPGALQVFVWLALRRAGRPVPLAELDFDILALQFRQTDLPEPVERPGKAKATPRKSAGRGRSSRTSTPE